jgi:hypothetical protein
MDALYPEAWLLASLGDRDASISWIDPALTTLPAADPGMFTDPTRAATLVRAMALLADLALGARDSTLARRWAAPVVLLWSGADGFLQPLVARLQRLTRN